MNDEDRRDRQMIELLNELRVALPGVQILFAFLLTVPFANGFTKVTDFQRDTYFVVLLLVFTATVFLIAPSTAHRLRFHDGDRPWLVEHANRMMIAGLVPLGLALIGAILLITDFLFDGAIVVIVPVLTAVLLGWLWFAVPLRRR